MPSLRDILDDPNYVNANAATKAAIFDRWAPKDDNYAKANDATKAAIRDRFGIGAPKVEEKRVEEPKPVQATEPSESSSDLIRGFTNYLPQLQETYGGAKVLAGKVVGSEDLMKSGLASMAAAKAELATKHKATDSFTSALDKGVGAVLTDWLPYQIGSGAANLVESLGVMMAGSALGSLAAPGVGTIAGGATGLVEKELVKRGIKELAEKVAKESGEEAAKELFERETKAVVKDLSKRYAAGAALAAQAGFHGAGETTSRAVEEAQRLGKEATDIEMERVLPAALVHGVAEYFGDKIGLGAWKNISDDAKTGVLNLASSLVKNTAITGTKEAPVEVIQSAAERFGAKLSLTDAQAVKEYIDSAAAAYGMAVGPAAGGTVRSFANAMAKEDARLAEEQMKAQEASQKAADEAAKISETAVVDPQGNVAPVSFTPIQPGAIGAAAPAATTTAAPAATTTAAPAATTPAVTDDIIKAAYAANDVSTEKARKALEPQLVAMGLDTKEKQKEFLNAKRDELGIPAFTPGAKGITAVKSKQAKEQWKVNYETEQLLKEGAPSGGQLNEADLAGNQPSAISTPSEPGVPTGGAATSVPGGMVPTGGAAQQSDVTTAAQPTTLEGAPSVTETTEAKQAEAQGQKQAAATEPVLLTPEQLKKGYTLLQEQYGEDLPAWKDLTEDLRRSLIPDIQAALQTKGMLPSKAAGTPTRSDLKRTQLKQHIAIVNSYNENRPSRLRQWSDLERDEQDIYLSQIKNNTAEDQDRAYNTLYNYLKSNEKIAKEGAAEEAVPVGASIYELNRQAYSSSLPRWGELDNDARTLFLKAISPGIQFDEEGKEVSRKVTDEQMDTGFADVWIHNAEKEARAPKEEKGKAQRVAKEEEAAAKEEVEVGKELPPLVKMMLGEGGINNVLSYIAKKAGGIMTGKKGPRSEALKNYEKRYGALSRAIFKNVAAALNTINFSKSQVVVDPNNAIIKQLQREGKLAAYDPKTDTFYFTRDGMDEMTVLHEIVHAGTIKILYAYKTNPNSLTREQREAAEQINKVYEFAKKRLESKYPNQMENVYEFVSYALTEPRFQEELSRIQAPSLAKYTMPPSGAPSGFNLQSLWSHLTKAMMKLYGLTKAATRFFEIKPDLYDEVSKAFGGEKYTRQKLEITKATKREVDVYIDREGKAKDLDAGTRLTFEAVSNLRDDVQSRLEDTYPEAFSDTTDQGVADFVEKYLSDKNFAEQVDKTSADVYKQAKVGVARQAGFQGNALIEVTQAFQGILAAPEAGIDIEALPAKKPAKPAKPPIQAPAGGSTSFEDMRNAMPQYNTNPARELSRMGKAKAGEAAVRAFQNERAAIKNWENKLRFAGRLVAYAAGFNNIYTQITLSSGNAHYLYAQYVQNHTEAIRTGVAEYAKKRNLSIDEAVNDLGLFAIALHEEERRRTLYIRTVPLVGQNPSKENPAIPTLKDAKGNLVTPFEARNAILKYLDKHHLDESGAKYLRDQLDKIVDDKNNLSKAKSDALNLDINSEAYNVAGFSPDQIKSARAEYNKNKADADVILKEIKELNKSVIALNEKSNYLSKYAKNYFMFYGYENYVPFKGKHFNEDKADIFNLDNRKLGGELQDQIHTFEGRLTVPDNPILQVMADGAQAAMRAGRKDVTQAIYNAVNDRTLQGSIMKFKDADGKEKDYISFEDRANDDILTQLKGETKVFHYMPDGKVAVIQIDDKNQREAIRRSYRETNPLLDSIVSMGNLLTGTLGQLHTRYNVAFAPVNFVRDVLTNAFTLGAELGPKEAFRYIGAVASGVAQGGMLKTTNFARLYSQGKTSTLEALANSDKTGYYRDLLDYIKTGGKVSYIAGIAPKGQYQEFFKGVGGNRILNTKDKVDRYFDMWIDTFELSARVASYRVTKASEIARLTKKDPTKSKKEIEEAATVTASAYAKNLANFEQVGQWGRALGAFFMFFRPSATGAVRAIDAIAPALNMNIERAVISTPEYARAANIRQELSKGVSATKEKELKAELAKMDEAVATYRENYSKAKTSARVMSVALISMGMAAYVMSYMMADDDEQGRNKTATDDMSRWTRFARFPIPGTDIIVQIPWGFGLGGMAAMGAQMASMFNGNTRAGDLIANMAVISMDSFLPLPVSRINPIEKPLPFLIDSMMPSVARPLVEYTMNVDALGRKIYNDRTSRLGDAYTGGDNIPEIYKDAAIWWLKTTGNDVSPNSLYFFANNYADGATRLVQNANNIRLWLSDKKDFNPKTDTMLFDSFFGTKANFDAREWSRVEADLEERSKYIKMLRDNHPADYAVYLSKNPMDQMLAKMYNHDVNGRLKDLREQANKWRSMEGLDPRTRTALVKNIVFQQNLEKRRLINLYKAYGVEP